MAWWVARLSEAKRQGNLETELRRLSFIPLIVVDEVRGLTFMDARGARELIRQNDFAHENRHNLAVVRGRKTIQRLSKLTAVEEILVMVDDPQDLAPPPSAPAG